MHPSSYAKNRPLLSVSASTWPSTALMNQESQSHSAEE